MKRKKMAGIFLCAMISIAGQAQQTGNQKIPDSVIAIFAKQQAMVKALTGTQAKDFTLQGLDGRSYHLKELKGKVAAGDGY